MLKKPLLQALAFAALWAVGSAAHAYLTVYTTQASFLAAVNAPGVDSFDDLDYTVPLASPQARMAGAYNYTLSADVTAGFFPASDDGVDVWVSPTNSTDTVTFDGFAPSLRAIGGFFFGSDLAGFSTAAPVLLLNVTDANSTLAQTLLNPGTTTFVGFVSDRALTSLSVATGPVAGAGTPGVWPTINDLTLAVAVPEPGSYALMWAGLGVLGVVMRKRKNV